MTINPLSAQTPSLVRLRSGVQSSPAAPAKSAFSLVNAEIPDVTFGRNMSRMSGSIRAIDGQPVPVMSGYRLAPCTVKAAMKHVKAWHRHLPDVQGGLFAVRVMAGDDCLGVGIAGNPSRAWQGDAKLVISRCATVGAENACSMIYGALARAAKALGYSEVWTYTLPEEPGTSLRAAGFMDMGMTAGGEYSRPSRSRRPAVRPEPKRRWLRKLAA